jgi:antitoxin component YwqK of YwqJK toxin-antitoxin module/predicted nucleic acid-binding Zn ribbon protein
MEPQGKWRFRVEYLIVAALLLHAVWVFFDAHKRRRHTLRQAAGWALGTLVLWLFVVPLYFAQRHLRAGETREGGDGWNYLKTLALLWTIVMFAVGAHYILAASEVASTAHTSAGQAGAAIGATLGIGLIAAVWFFPVLGALLLGLVLKKTSIVEKGPTGPLAFQAPGAVTPGLTACPTCGKVITTGAVCSTCGPSTPPERKSKRRAAVVGIMAAVLVIALVAVGLLKGIGTATELREEKYPNGALKSRGHVRQDADKNYVLVGLWTYWFPNGQKEAEGEYVNGQEGGKRGGTGILVDGRNGPWTIWHSNGQKRQVSEYKNGNEWVRTTWHENGQMEAQGRYEDGKEEGVWTTWHKNGKKDREGSFKNGKLEGFWTDWYENGQKEAEGRYRDGEEQGVWTFWHENGQKEKEGRYEGGKEEGVWTNWYENGKKKTEGRYEDGKEAGVWTYLYENGQKEKEGRYEDGKQEGVWTLWYENGQKEGAAEYKDGEQNGLLRAWYQNGQKELETTTAHGEVVGPGLAWSQDGRRVKYSASAAASAEPAVVTDDNDHLRFGKPTIKAKTGMTRVIVQARNMTDQETTCVVTATFMKGESILGTARGAANSVPAAGTRTVELFTVDDIRGYDTLKLEAGTCF